MIAADLVLLFLSTQRSAQLLILFSPPSHLDMSGAFHHGNLGHPMANAAVGLISAGLFSKIAEISIVFRTAR